MNAGPLQHRITLQSRTPVQDGIGGEVQGPWTDVSTVWADIRYLSGIETVKADAPADVTRCSIRIRWRAGVNVGMRAMRGATIYDIKSALPDLTGREYLDLVAETGQNLG